MMAANGFSTINKNEASEQTDLMKFETGTKLKEIERVVILETLKSQNFNRTHAARVLGIGIRTLQRKLKKYGVPDIGLKMDDDIVEEKMVSGFSN